MTAPATAPGTSAPNRGRRAARRAALGLALALALGSAACPGGSADGQDADPAAEACGRACACGGDGSDGCARECAAALDGAVDEGCAGCVRATACGDLVAGCATACPGDAGATIAALAGEREGPPVEGEPFCAEAEEVADGIGRRCASDADCAGTAAPLCPRARSPEAPDLCTRECDAARTCPAGTFCCEVRGTCLPNRCVRGCDFVRDPEGKTECAERPEVAINDLGLGEPCFIDGECAGWSMKLCSGNKKGGKATGRAGYCTIHCECNDECGEGGICFPSFVHRCSPAACYPGHAGVPCE